MGSFQVLEKLERMESIDFKSIINETVTEFRNMPLEKRTGGWPGRCATRIRVTPDTVRSALVFAVWCMCFARLNEHAEKDGPLAVEKALTIMVGKGAVKDKIRFKKNSFRVQLTNAQYRIYKTDDRSFYACPWPSEKRCRLLVFGEALADFMIRFDEEVPHIVSHVTTIMETIRARELEETKRAMEDGIKDHLVKSLIEQYLKTSGLSVQYHIGEGDIVSLNLRKVLSAHIEIPLGELADQLKDTAGIVDSLRVEDPETERDS